MPGFRDILWAMQSRRKGGRAARLATRRATGQAKPAPGPPRRAAPPLPGRVLFLCCGALVCDILELARENGWDHVDVRGLPARLHNYPHKIPDVLRQWIKIARPRYNDRIFIVYGDCGTGGAVDAICRDEQLTRIPGPHCYSFLSGNQAFADGLDDNATTYYLTDFLLDHFETLVVADLWLDRRPELVEMFFGHYEKLTYLAQTDDRARDDKAAKIARELGLRYERQPVGRGDLEPFVRAAATGSCHGTGHGRSVQGSNSSFDPPPADLLKYDD
ncbi:MAG: DUF1638 domain-containing protein [Hyphomicrobiales bacterium]